MIYRYVGPFCDLLKTTVGCATFIYPQLMYNNGILQTILLSVFSAMMSSFGVLFYSLVYKKVGAEKDYQNILKEKYPKTMKVINFIIGLKCFSVVVLYLIIIKKIILLITNYICEQKQIEIDNNITKYIINSILLVIYFPLYFLIKMCPIEKLKFTSIFGISLIFLMLLLSIYNYTMCENKHTIAWFKGTKNILVNYGSFIYGFTCHQNIYVVQNNCPTNSVKKFMGVVILVMATASTIYLLFGLMNSKIYGDALDVDILTLYCSKHGNLGVIILVLYGLMFLVSIPHQAIPCTKHWIKLFNTTLENENIIMNYLLPIALAIPYLISISDGSFESYINTIGGTVSALICFSFGPALYLISKKKKNKTTIFATIICLFGIIVCTEFIIRKINQIKF